MKRNSKVPNIVVCAGKHKRRRVHVSAGRERTKTSCSADHTLDEGGLKADLP